MGGLDNILEAITHPMAKWVLLIFGLRALWSLVRWRACPVAAGRIDAEQATEIAAKRNALWRHSTRFALIMVAGIGLSVAGLYKLATYGGDAPIALLMLFLGIYLFSTEPVRMQIQDAEGRVLEATGGRDPESQAMAQAMLRGSHVNLVGIEIAAVVTLALAVLALESGMTPM